MTDNKDPRSYVNSITGDVISQMLQGKQKSQIDDARYS